MSNSIFDKLSLGAINSTVTAFKNLVDDHISSTKSTTSQSDKFNVESLNSLEDTYTKFKQTAESTVTEFDFNLYTSALKLPECQSVSFSYNEEITNNLIGTFNGNKIFKDFNGTIKADTDSTISQITNQVGKIIIDPASAGYAIFTFNDTSEIISLNDFSSKPLVNDFSDLYQNLLNNKFSKLENYISDIKSLGSLFTSFSEYTTDDIIGSVSSQISSFAGDLIDSVQSQWDPIVNDIFSTIDSFKNNIIPDTINSTQTTLSIPDASNKYINNIKSNNTDNTTDTSLGIISDIAKGVSDLTGKKTKSTTNNIKPINLDPDGDGWIDQNRGEYKHIKSSIYDNTKGFGDDIKQNVPIQAIITYDGLASPLICYQQPENLSYSASAQFDGIPSRGTQQPFQFYNCANQITLGFSLKWHYDELLLYGLDKTYPSLQEIADIAEDFTRPFQIGASDTDGNSITPKLCTVILPSLSEIGYITEAQISFGGAMTGTDPYNKSESNNYSAVDESNSASITRNGDDYIYKTHVSNTNYQYSTLEISFQLLIVKDITLKPDAATQKAIKALATGDPEQITAAKQLLDSFDFDNGMSVGMPVLPEEPVSDAIVSNQANYEASISSNSRNVTTPYEDYNSNSSQPAQNANSSSNATNVSNVSATNNTTNKGVDYYQLLLDRGMDANLVNYLVTTENITPKELYDLITTGRM